MRSPLSVAARMVANGVFAVPTPQGPGYVLVMADGTLGARLPNRVLDLLVRGGFVAQDDDGVYRITSVRTPAAS